jgi:hypothetical protein
MIDDTGLRMFVEAVAALRKSIDRMGVDVDKHHVTLSLPKGLVGDMVKVADMVEEIEVETECDVIVHGISVNGEWL